MICLYEMRASFLFPSIGTTTYPVVKFKRLFPFPIGIYLNALFVCLFVTMGGGESFFPPLSGLTQGIAALSESPSTALSPSALESLPCANSLLAPFCPSLGGLSQQRGHHLYLIPTAVKDATLLLLQHWTVFTFQPPQTAGLPAASCPSVLPSFHPSVAGLCGFIPLQTLYIPEWHLGGKRFGHLCSFLSGTLLESTG